MKLKIQTPNEALKESALPKPLKQDFETFAAELRQTMAACKEISMQTSAAREKQYQDKVSGFLKSAFYGNRIHVEDGKMDLTIHENNKAESPVFAIFEFKTYGAKNDMISTDADGFNCKAFYELTLYFLRERYKNKNRNIKRLIATNVVDWFIFDARDFEQFYRIKEFQSFVNGDLSTTSTDDFYKEIAPSEIAKIDSEIPCLHFNLENATNKQLQDVYRILSPQYLVKESIVSDGNTLNEKFYAELLHIIGLEEITEKSKKFIRRKSKPDEASLLEQTIENLIYTNAGTQFEEALELVITWINRVLFLKLLEAQLVRYNGGDKSFKILDPEKIQTFSELDALFFNVLALPADKRSAANASKFGFVPYLNSALFEKTAKESENICISTLIDTRALPLFAQTTLKDGNGKKRSGTMPVLKYLFAFLGSYNFGAEINSEGLIEKDKVINAAVLGLIFEKINGYKDGSFFTPSFITMYMCREAINRAVVQKFNEIKKWNCKTLDDVYNKIDNPAEANKILNSLRLCDPAVGSGHFLVSALNQIIVIKHKLEILCDKNGRRLKNYNIEIENDELKITDNEGTPFEYNPKNAESARVQKTLFDEKRTVIENCLFGVDINPKSVDICRLRLWIELLKNAYYKNDGNLETLPNIDINIKCGNSLVSRFPVKIGEGIKRKDGDSRKMQIAIADYKKLVRQYKNTSDKFIKRGINAKLAEIKKMFSNEGVQLDVFKTTQNDDLLQQAIYKNSLEWSFEFPETLDDNGNFLGFDVVIGNPPYVQTPREVVNANFFVYSEGKDKGKQNLYKLFVELSYNLLKQNGNTALIVQSSLMGDMSAQYTRELLLKKTNLMQVIEFPKTAQNKKGQLFKNALQGTCIVWFTKNLPDEKHAFQISANNDGTTIEHSNSDNIAQKSLIEFYPNGFCIPLVRKGDFAVIKKINDCSQFLKTKIEQISQGDFNLTTEKYCFAQTKTDVKMYRGKHVHDFYIDNEVEEYIQSGYKANIVKENETKIFLICQQITGTTDKRRLHFSINKKDKCLFGNSVNKIGLKDGVNVIFILALLNSKLMDWYFRKTSTNNHVNGYEIEQLPIPAATASQQKPIIKLVEKIIAAKKVNPQADTSATEKEIDRLVYSLYNLTNNEIKTIESGED